MPQQSTIRNPAEHGTLARMLPALEGACRSWSKSATTVCPRWKYWGPDLGEQTPEDFAAVVLGLAPLPAPSQVEVRPWSR